MKLSIIGAGNVGQALGRVLVARGQSVTFGVPDPSKYADAVATLGPQARLTTVDDAVHDGEIVILAVPYAAAESVARAVGDWGGRILVDATNPLAPGLNGLSIGTTTSGAEAIAAAARNARVVKAFNTTGAENLADPRYPKGEVLMPVAGDDADARAKVVALATLIGFDAVEMGDLRTARYLEPFAMTWIHLALKQGHGRRFAFARVQR